MRTDVQRVAAAVQERRAASVDDLLPLFPHLERRQVTRALENGQKRGLVRLSDARGVWAAGHVRVGEYRQSNAVKRPANSPWELAEDLRINGRWPPTSHEGRRYQLLGGWTD